MGRASGRSSGFSEERQSEKNADVAAEEPAPATRICALPLSLMASTWFGDETRNGEGQSAWRCNQCVVGVRRESYLVMSVSLQRDCVVCLEIGNGYGVQRGIRRMGTYKTGEGDLINRAVVAEVNAHLTLFSGIRAKAEDVPARTARVNELPTAGRDAAPCRKAVGAASRHVEGGCVSAAFSEVA